MFQRPGKATFEPRVKGEAFLRLSVEPIGSMVAWWKITEVLKVDFDGRCIPKYSMNGSDGEYLEGHPS